MEIIYFVVGFLAGIVTMLFILWIIIPIFDALLYGLGYTIFNISCTNRDKAMKVPHRYVIIVLKWYIIGFGERLLYGSAGTHTIGKNEWQPYFHYNTKG